MVESKSELDPKTGRNSEARDPILWGILTGFFAIYLLVFIAPTFLNASRSMLFVRYIPTMREPGSIAEDARAIHYFVAGWLNGEDPYQVEAISNGVTYPPLALVLLYPLGPVSPQTAYAMLLGLTLVCFVALTLWLPIRIFRRLTPIILLFFVTGLISYGLQFELERGQFNVIAVCLALLGVYVFHAWPDRRLARYAAYVLLTLAIQLKLYPAIFVLALVTDWTAWGTNLKRLALIAGANLALLFALGTRIFTAFWNSVFLQITATMGEKINHSAASFAALWSAELTNAAPGSSLTGADIFIRDHPNWVQLGFLGIFAALLGLSIFIAVRRGMPGNAPHLLLTFTILALIAPSLSYDYALAYLAAPMAIFMQHLSGNSARAKEGQLTEARGWLRFSAAAVISIAYAWTLFSYTNKPDTLAFSNNLPALILMLLAIPVLMIL